MMDEIRAEGGDAAPHVGYAIGGERYRAVSARIVYCTYGVALAVGVNRLAAAYTHIIIDEVHERLWQSDLLQSALKALLWTGNKCKVLVMSARLDSVKFRTYFNQPPSGAHNMVTCVVQVPARGWEPRCELRYLEDDLPVVSNAARHTELRDAPDWQQAVKCHPPCGSNDRLLSEARQAFAREFDVDLHPGELLREERGFARARERHPEPELLTSTAIPGECLLKGGQNSPIGNERESTQ